jgi:putative 30S ribosomal protein S1
LFRLEVFVSDVSFDSNKHDQTRQDATKGAESLKTAADGIDTFAGAQVESVWGEEASVDAARRALRAAYQAVGEGYATESTNVLDFGGKVDQSEAEFLQMEEENAGYFSQASAALMQDPAVAAAAAGVSGSGSSSSAGSSNASGSPASTGASNSGSQGEEDSNADPNSDF